jgi:glycosyltransferase involved in cell wall biosynthesis
MTYSLSNPRLGELQEGNPGQLLLYENLDISLVIATRNRSRQLVACLEAVSRLIFEGAWEVIVVDNGSTDGASVVIDNARAAIRAPLIKLTEPEPGVAKARNRAIAAARGKIVAFTDDDCYVDPHYLTEIIRAFDDESIGYVTGRVELYDPSDAAVTIKTSRTPQRYPARNFVYGDCIIGANLAFRRAVLLQIHGFDECMGGGRMFSAEDIDIAARASSAGWDGAYRPEILVHHHHGRKQHDVRKLYHFYDVGRGAYTIKYLLRGEFISFSKGVASVRWRMGPIRSWRLATFSTPAWELYGAIAYLLLRLKALLGAKAHAIAKMKFVRFRG